MKTRKQGLRSSSGVVGIRVHHLSLGRVAAALFVVWGVGACSSATKDNGRSQRATSAPNDVARFLEQATLGPTPGDLQHLQVDLAGDYSAWLDEQFAMPASNYPDVCCSGTITGTVCDPVIPCSPFPAFVDAYPQTRPANCVGVCQRDNYTMWKLQTLF